MPGLPPATVIAATVGILGSAWNSGNSPVRHHPQNTTANKKELGGQAMLSFIAIPGLIGSTSPVTTQALAQQWAGMYNRGKVLGPQVAVLSMLGYGYLVYQRKSQNQPGWGMFAGAAALTLGIVPFTLLFMDTTVQSLLRVAEGTSVLGETAVKELLVRWKGLNLVRSLFPLAGGVLGFWSLVA